MSPRQSRKGVQEDNSDSGMQMSGTPHIERQYSSLQSPPHIAVTSTCKSQFPCVFKDQDDRSAPMLRFLLLVAYGQILAGPNQINDGDRLRCPIMRCREPLHDQSRLLEHVFRCAQYSDGRYWCFHCQNEESFAPCQASPFRKDRLSVRAKRIFRWLGNKSHQKDHEASATLSLSKETSGLFNNHCSADLPDYVEALPVTAEMESSKILRELGDDDVPAPAELHGFTSPAELYSENAPPSAFELEVPYARSESLLYPATHGGAPSASGSSSMDAVQALPSHPFSFEGPIGQFHAKNGVKPTSEEGLRQLQSPVSPQSAEWIPASYTQAICESPTDTEFTGDSIFSKFFGTEISPPSTRNSTMQSFSHSLSSVEVPSECPPSPSFIPNIVDEIPHNMVQGNFAGEELASNNPTLSPSRSTERHASVRLGSSQWLTPKDVLCDFWKVLTLHVAESSEKLNTLPNSPAIDAVLSMTTETIADTGFSLWKGMIHGQYPVTIAHLYALVHVAYACAIVDFDGQLGNHTDGLFTHSLAIGVGALPDGDKLIFANIASSIWSPPLSEKHLRPSYPVELINQPDQALTGLLRAKGMSRSYPIDVNEPSIRSLCVKGTPGTLELQPNEGNKISNVLDHFSDIFGGITFCTEVCSANGKHSSQSIDEKFVRTVKDYVSVPLKEYLQSAPPLEAFAQVVTVIESLVNIGKIMTVHELEVALIWSARSTVQSMELYELFRNRVKELCSGVFLLLYQDPALQNEARLQCINAMCIALKVVISEARQLNLGGEHRCQAGIGSDASSTPPKQVNTFRDCNTDTFTIDGMSHSTNIPEVELSRRPAVKRKRSSGCSLPETVPSPASSPCLSESSESEYSRCSICGFRPKGARRWYKRTLDRHMETHREPGQKKVHHCEYDGCHSSFSRLDNLQQHARTVHQYDKRQCNPNVNSGSSNFLSSKGFKSSKSQHTAYVL